MGEDQGCSTEERRQSERHAIGGRFYANACRSGLICDLSRTGLAFQYIDRKRWPADAGRLEIVSDEAGFYLGDLAYRVVSDEKIKKSTDPTLTIKRMGLAFRDLTSDQQKKIDALLQTLACAGQE